MPGTSHFEKQSDDPEYFNYDCLQIVEVERMLNEAVAAICDKIPVCKFSLVLVPL